MIAVSTLGKLARRRIFSGTGLLLLSAPGAAIAAPVVVNSPDNDGVVLNATDDALENNSTITNGLGQIAVSGGDPVVFILNSSGSEIAGASNDGVEITSSVGDFTNHGRITGSGTQGSAVTITGPVQTFTNTGLLESLDFDVVRLEGGVGTFTNSGTISGRFDSALRVLGTTGSFTNTAAGVIRTTEDNGLRFGGLVTDFTNDGEITSFSNSVTFFGGVTSALNRGTITASSSGSAVDMRGSGGVFENRGTIRGPQGIIYNLPGAGNATVINSGRVEGTGGTAISMTGGNDTLSVTPTSSITGNVLAALGSDTLILGGDGNGAINANSIGSAAQYRGFELLRKEGGSNWTVAGTTADVLSGTVSQGRLNISALMPNTSFAVDGGILAGSGTVGDVAVSVGGALAPGDAVGTMSTGALTFAPGSVYQVEVSAAGVADRVLASGAVTINGGTVQVLAEPTNTCPTTTNYTIVTSTGARTGVFDAVTSNYAFLVPELSYDANNVYLSLASNATPSTAFAGTPNQTSTSEALGVTGCGSGGSQANPYAAQFLALGSADVAPALDALSGEAHAALKGVFLESSGFVRKAALDRVEQAFQALDLDAGANSYASSGDVGPSTDRNLGLWAHAYGGRGTIASDGNAAQTDFGAGGLLVGADGTVGDEWLLGVLAGVGVTNISARAADGNSTDLSLAGYGGSEWGPVGLKFGAAYTRHLISTRRTIQFPGVNDVVSARHGADTVQAFAELSYDIELGAFTLTPFGGLALVGHHTDAFTETGAPGALSSAESWTNAAFTTLGVRGEHQFIVGGDMLMTLEGNLGWRHAFADLPTAMNSFAASPAFTVAGAPISRDALVFGTKLSVDISEELDLGLGYEGQLGNRSSVHSVRLSVGGKF